MSTPTRRELAAEMAERNGECGFVNGELICTQPKGHSGSHKGQPIKRYLPIE